MKKQYTALLVAFAVTVCMAAGMFLISGSALMNKNGLPVANSPAEATATFYLKKYIGMDLFCKTHYLSLVAYFGATLNRRKRN